jgi:hypothetical protein
MSGSFGFRHILKQRIPRYLDLKQRTTGLQDLRLQSWHMGHYGKHTSATPSETHVRKLLKLTAQSLLAATTGHPEHLLGRGGREELWVASASTACGQPHMPASHKCAASHLCRLRNASYQPQDTLLATLLHRRTWLPDDQEGHHLLPPHVKERHLFGDGASACQLHA